MDQKKIFGWFFQELLRNLKQCGFSNLADYVWTSIKLGTRGLGTVSDRKHYENYEEVSEVAQLRILQQACNSAMDLLPNRTKAFYKGQDAGMIALVRTYCKDKYMDKQDYVSKTDKDMQRAMASKSGVLYNQTFESRFREPAFYVRNALDAVEVVVRGTVSKEDIYVDLDAQPEQHDGFFFHQAFYASGLSLFRRLEAKGLLKRENKYRFIGHSLGASVAVIAAYLVRKHYTEQVECIGFGMSCVGDLKFSVFAQAFCTSVVSAYDMVPTISYHATRVMLLRMLLLEAERCGEQRRELLTHEFPEADLRHQVRKAFYKLKQQTFLPTRVISEELMRSDDLYIAGKVLHFIDGKLLKVSVHDVSESVYQIPTVIDHTGYYTFEEWLVQQVEARSRNAWENTGKQVVADTIFSHVK